MAWSRRCPAIDTIAERLVGSRDELRTVPDSAKNGFPVATDVASMELRQMKVAVVPLRTPEGIAAMVL